MIDIYIMYVIGLYIMYVIGLFELSFHKVKKIYDVHMQVFRLMISLMNRDVFGFSGVLGAHPT